MQKLIPQIWAFQSPRSGQCLRNSASCEWQASSSCIISVPSFGAMPPQCKFSMCCNNKHSNFSPLVRGYALAISQWIEEFPQTYGTFQSPQSGQCLRNTHSRPRRGIQPKYFSPLSQGNASAISSVSSSCVISELFQSPRTGQRLCNSARSYRNAGRRAHFSPLRRGQASAISCPRTLHVHLGQDFSPLRRGQASAIGAFVMASQADAQFQSPQRGSAQTCVLASNRHCFALDKQDFSQTE